MNKFIVTAIALLLVTSATKADDITEYALICFATTHVLIADEVVIESEAVMNHDWAFWKQVVNGHMNEANAYISSIEDDLNDDPTGAKQAVLEKLFSTCSDTAADTSLILEDEVTRE